MQRNVGALCIRDVVVAEGTDSVLELARLMREQHVGAVVIVRRRGDRRYPVGIVTDRDIVVDALVGSLDVLTGLMAQDLVRRPVVVVREDLDIDDALETMRQHGVRRVPVVDDDGALVGILAVDDVVQILADRLAELAILFARERRIERDIRP